MGSGLHAIFASIASFWGNGFSGLVQYFSNAFSTVPGAVTLLLGALVIGILAIIATIAIYAERRRDIAMDLRTLSEAMDEQSRLMEKMRRTLIDITEALAALESAGQHRMRIEAATTAHPNGPTHNPPFTLGPDMASALREELELLKAEISSDLSVGPTAD
jgi:hypothetical protein